VDSADDLARQLAAIRARRGYLLPHHGLMAVSSPRLLEAYDATYAALALEPRTLSRHDHEFAWLAILVATDEALATHHLPKFRAGGGTDAEFAGVLRIVAFALGFPAYRFIDRHWRPHLPDFDPNAEYLTAFRAVAGDVPLRLAHLAAATVHTCRAAWDALAWQIVAAYADAVPEDDLAEALSLTMFPGSVPYFVEAAGVWRQLIVDGRVPASPRYRAWAAVAGQGGYDEASGTGGHPASPSPHGR
jgi:alkylhydroperoxidase/carboxymuconolactone decarboxylase family protein YurZ